MKPLLSKIQSSFFTRITTIVQSFSRKERIAFFIALWIAIIGCATLGWIANIRALVEVPSYGGSLSEGIIGTPRFINPVLAVSSADRDMTTLLYAGLTRISENGDIVPHLAENYTVSNNGTLYTFTLRDDALFHDGEAITAEDVVFTVGKAQDSALKSPRRANWDGVSAEAIDERTVTFTLPEPYAPFLSNTTLGILPKHIWNNLTAEEFSFSQFNIEPIGSGPYKLDAMKRDASGIQSYYDLKAFTDFAPGEPYLSRIRVHFYDNEEELIDAYEKNDIESMNAVSPDTVASLEEEGARVLRIPLPRVFGVFFNQDQANIFTDSSVRRALDTAINTDRIVRDILLGYGTAIHSPVPPGALGYTSPEEDTPIDTLAEARTILEDGNWEWTPSEPTEENLDPVTGTWQKEIDDSIRTLSFSLATSNTPELKTVAEYVKSTWEALGIPVTVQYYEAGDLSSQVIRPRMYDTLLFGEIVGRDSDLFAFWHSSQRNDPGLNVALYANISVDDVLERAREENERELRAELIAEAAEEIAEETPAVFLYAPDFLYILPEDMRGVTIGSVTTPAERFSGIGDWHMETEYIWSVFTTTER
ncbi:MAG: peptide ABC transporter substrate-binding protein [Parcubacteria group bacterium]|nr:peptide ABC transporter substrate-binding protein [Parcubacteria group bacterium]